MTVCVPERKDDQAGDDEDSCKADEDVVAGVSPASIVEHLCRLLEKRRKEGHELNLQEIVK